MGGVTERIQILRKTSVSDGAGGLLEGVETSVFSGMATQKPQTGEKIESGFKPFLNIRRRFTFFRPASLTVSIGDVVVYRNQRYSILALPTESADRRQWTLYTELMP